MAIPSCPVTMCLSLCEKVPFQLSCKSPLGAGKLLYGLLLSKLKTFSSLDWKIPTFSTCLHRRGASSTNHLCGLLLDPFKSLLMLWDPELDAAVFQLGSYQSRVEGQNLSLALLTTLLWMQPRIPVAFWAGNIYCWGMFTLIHQHTQVFLSRAALNPFTSQPVLMCLCLGFLGSSSGPCTWPYWNLWCLHRPTSQIYNSFFFLARCI